MKRQLSLVVALAFAACASASSISRLTDGRIIGGVATTVEEHPYQVSLVYGGSHRCGGSIISEYFVVSAAHCFSALSSSAVSLLKIRAGSTYRTSGGTLHAVSWYTYHASFTTATYDYDVAIVKVKVPFEFGSTIQPIELAPADYTLAEGTLVGVSGWGRLSLTGSAATVLQVVEVPMISNTYCGELYSYLQVSITDRMICAGYEAGTKDACYGDSGGPLFYGNVLVGIVSWGDECAIAYQPGVYSSVSSLRDWISEKTGLDFD